MLPAWVGVAGGLLAMSVGGPASGVWAPCVYQDYFSAVRGWGLTSMTLVHMFFMRLFALEATFLNFYVLVGLMVCLGILGLVLVWSGGGRAYRRGVASRGLGQGRRLAAPQMSRRSWRRRNATLSREVRCHIAYRRSG